MLCISEVPWLPPRTLQTQTSVSCSGCCCAAFLPRDRHIHKPQQQPQEGTSPYSPCSVLGAQPCSVLFFTLATVAAPGFPSPCISPSRPPLLLPNLPLKAGEQLCKIVPLPRIEQRGWGQSVSLCSTLSLYHVEDATDVAAEE